MPTYKPFCSFLALGLIVAHPVAGSEAVATGSIDASAGGTGARVSASAKQTELQFEPAPEGWQRDVAWQIFGFSGKATLPQFFYRIPDDPDEAKAVIDSITTSPLVGRVQLLDAVVMESIDQESATGSVVTDVKASWEVEWEGMGRSAPWINRADSGDVLRGLSEVITMSGFVPPDNLAGVQPEGVQLQGNRPTAGRDIILGINVPIRDIEQHAVGRGTLRAVQDR
jgi:hypothetical protein